MFSQLGVFGFQVSCCAFILFYILVLFKTCYKDCLGSGSSSSKPVDPTLRYDENMTFTPFRNPAENQTRGSSQCTKHSPQLQIFVADRA